MNEEKKVYFTFIFKKYLTLCNGLKCKIGQTSGMEKTSGSLVLLPCVASAKEPYETNYVVFFHDTHRAAFKETVNSALL